MSILSNITNFIYELFCVDLNIFKKSIQLSPNAQANIIGAISEFYIKQLLEKKDFTVFRIKEKWDGEKKHHGDFYFKKNGTNDWFVLESKGLKSNTERWNKLYNKDRIISFLEKKIEFTPFKTEKEIKDYINIKLPLFNTKYVDNIYEYSEVYTYQQPRRITNKSQAMEKLKKLSVAEIEILINERLNYVMSKIKVLDTHLVAGVSKTNKRKIATPRNDEFHILIVNLFLRTNKHEFILVKPRDLEPSQQYDYHLQQNYIIDILITDLKDRPIINEPWTDYIEKLIPMLENPINDKDMQIDYRADKY